jgi:transposase
MPAAMIVIGIDVHKRTHTAVIVNERGRKLATRTIATTRADHLALLRWAAEHDRERVWAVEDCRNMTRRLEADLLVAGERVTRVPTKLMAGARDTARTHGKFDALAVARAALREPDLPTARLDGPDREVRLLVDVREALVGERTRTVNRLRWHLHELDPGWDPTPRSLDRDGAYQAILARLDSPQGMVARLARALVQHCRQLTEQIDALLAEISTLVTRPAPTLLGTRGCGPLTAVKILGETADIHRFRSRDAYARHNGTAPLPVWSSNRACHRLSRTGNRQPDAALHRIALTRARCHPDARTLARRRTGGNGGLETDG